ncbi:MAG: phosphohistidine phosphatase SixA [Arsenophonus endosymbiont of Dermacentor nuttalli]
MQVFIMRHGDATLNTINDEARELTLEGIDESKLMASWLAQQNPVFERVFTSPYLRAVQTYQAMQPLLPYSGEHEVLSELIPDGDPQRIANYLQLLAEEGIRTALIISHLPLVSYLVSALCPQEIPPMFTTSAIAYVEINTEIHHAEYRWQREPSQILQSVNKLAAHF